MKRMSVRAALCALLLMLMGSVLSLPVGAASVIRVDDISIMVNGSTFQPTDANGKPVRVFAYNGTTYAPLRALAEAYGLSVGYSSKLSCAYVYEGKEPDLSGVRVAEPAMTFPQSSGKTQLIVTPMNIVVKGNLFRPTDVNGNAVAVFATGGTTYAPLRALAEAYGLEVGYDAKQQLAYVTRPGEDAPFTQLSDGAKLIAPGLEQPKNDGTAVPSPVTYFARTLKPSTIREDLQELERVSSAAVPDYLELLEQFGFEMCGEDLGYVHNTWCFMKKGSTTDPGEHYENCDLIVYHYYDSKGKLKVVIRNEECYFADFGHRHEGKSTAPYAGERAADSYVLKGGSYRNDSDELLEVPAGARDKSTYSYAKSAYHYSYSSFNGMCTLIVNGSELESHSALLCDFNSSNGSYNDMLVVWHHDGTELLKIRWKKDTFQSGEAYNLNDFIQSLSYNGVHVEYNKGKFYNLQSVDAVTVRPLWLDRTGNTESLVYFYVEIGDGEGGVELTLEGLVAAPFNLAEKSEYTESRTGSSSTSSSSSSGVYDPFDHAKMECLFCHGDGDCTTCNGYGEVRRYAGQGDTVKTKCPDCRGSGDCKKCGGTGKR